MRGNTDTQKKTRSGVKGDGMGSRRARVLKAKYSTIPTTSRLLPEKSSTSFEGAVPNMETRRSLVVEDHS
jgi:hypothetical protein